MATWNKILTEKEVKNRTLNTILGQTSFNGIKAGHVNFMEPIINASRFSLSSGEASFPHLEFSDNQTLDNKAIKRWTYGLDETGSDSTTAYFDLVGDQTMDDLSNPGLANGLMGCAIPVPMGRSDVGFHDIDLNFTASHEGADDPNAPVGSNLFRVWKPTIWRAYANDEFTATGNASALKFRLVVFGNGVTYDQGSGSASQLTVAFPPPSSHAIGTGIASWRVPVHSSDSEWESKICYYMVGFHIDELDTSGGQQPQTFSVQWPSTANAVTGRKQCSIVANFRVTYTAN